MHVWIGYTNTAYEGCSNPYGAWSTAQAAMDYMGGSNWIQLGPALWYQENKFVERFEVDNPEEVIWP